MSRSSWQYNSTSRTQSWATRENASDGGDEVFRTAQALRWAPTKGICSWKRPSCRATTSQVAADIVEGGDELAKRPSPQGAYGAHVIGLPLQLWQNRQPRRAAPPAGFNQCELCASGWSAPFGRGNDISAA